MPSSLLPVSQIEKSGTTNSWHSPKYEACITKISELKLSNINIETIKRTEHKKYKGKSNYVSAIYFKKVNNQESNEVNITAVGLCTYKIEVEVA